MKETQVQSLSQKYPLEKERIFKTQSNALKFFFNIFTANYCYLLLIQPYFTAMKPRKIQNFWVCKEEVSFFKIPIVYLKYNCYNAKPKGNGCLHGSLGLLTSPLSWGLCSFGLHLQSNPRAPYRVYMCLTEESTWRS